MKTFLANLPKTATKVTSYMETVRELLKNQLDTVTDTQNKESVRFKKNFDNCTVKRKK